MKKEQILKISKKYYLRKDILEAIKEESKNREVVPKYFDIFGKRPDMIEYENDIRNLALKGATSFHCSEELWKDPLELKTEMSREELNNLRIGWDLIIDIDSKYLDYSRITAQLIIEALKFHNIKNFGLKFSGGSGFHIGLGNRAFPFSVNKIKIKNFFPEGPRLIASYLKEMISKPLKEKIPELKYKNLVDIDTILISSRHLFRMPYSLHEKTGLASIVLTERQLQNFRIEWAKPSRIYPKKFLPEPEKNEAKELLIQALDWMKIKKETQEKRKIKIKTEKISKEIYPPCMRKILNGMKKDGRKRALFILINFFRSLGFNFEEIEKKIEEWNKKNYGPLKDGYINSQISWFKRNKIVLPPNCNTSYYRDINVCEPNPLCQKIKNPINYVFKKYSFSNIRKKREKKNIQ